MSRIRILCLGAGEGWHSQQLTSAAQQLDCELQFATYESLHASVVSGRSQFVSEVGPVDVFDAVLTRTMPAGTLEQVTFRLAILHAIDAAGSIPVINPPRSLEIAIDKFATLHLVSELGYPVPETAIAQDRSQAVEAFDRLGGDCVVKPIFGGEGRGVMRVRDAELAWTTFSTLENLGAICYVQRFVAPGGCDTRLLVIGDQVHGIRRRNSVDFRTNVSSGARCERIEVSESQAAMSRRICEAIGLRFASVDILDSEDGEPRILEVNAIPGWKGAQGVAARPIAEEIVGLVREEVTAMKGVSC
ncbi:MAG: ATP-grasp domain-containing protein [Rubripirellula sp.]